MRRVETAGFEHDSQIGPLKSKANKRTEKLHLVAFQFRLDLLDGFYRFGLHERPTTSGAAVMVNHVLCKGRLGGLGEISSQAVPGCLTSQDP